MSNQVDRTIKLTRPEVDLLYSALDALIMVSSDSMIDGHENAELQAEIGSANALKSKIRDAKTK